MVRRVKLEDANQLVEIYNHYILNSVVTFEEACIDCTEMKNRILSMTSKYPWLVYEKEGEIMGYAYACEWKSRTAYKRTVESTIYLKQGEMNKGIGSSLYKELICQLSDMGIHAIIGGISLPNEPSIYLHEKFGFEKVAQFKEVGHKFKKWIDVGYWELIIDKAKNTL